MWTVVTMAGCIGDVSSPSDAGSSRDSAVLADASDGVHDGSFDATTNPGTGAGDGATADSSVSEAGSGDGGVAADAGGDASVAAGCTAAHFLFCEDFESAADGALPTGWSVLGGWGGGSAPKVVSDAQHTGKRALETGVAATGQTRVQHSLSALGAAANKHWGRVFFKARAPAPPPTSGVLHNTLVALRGADESRVVDTVINTAGAHQFLYNIPDDSFGKGSSYDYHAYDGDWHCAEWYVDTSSQSYRFFFEGTEVTSIAFSGEAGARLNAFDTLAIGFIGYQAPSTPYDGWFDDLALNGTRIGCD